MSVFIVGAKRSLIFLPLIFAVLHPPVRVLGSQMMPSGRPMAEQQEPSKTREEEAPSDGTPRIALKEIAGNPGSGLMVPLYYTSGTVPLRSITLDIQFVSKNLKFGRISEGVLPEGTTADIQGKIVEESVDKAGLPHSRLRVSISLAGKQPVKGLPNGLLAFLFFNVSSDAKPFIIKLSPTLVSAEDINVPPKQVAKVNMVPGTVTVETLEITPEATCFFFNH